MSHASTTIAPPAPPPAPVVLVVEDDPLLRLDAVCLVEDAGFEAVEAGDADEAVAILISRNDIRVVFTDIDMPGSMDGLLLAIMVRDRWPPIELILASGQRFVASHDIPARGRFFTKPFDEAELKRTLRAFMA